jgi:hypothetical protein
LRSSLVGPLAMLALAACDLERVAIGRTEAQVALHGVLSASAPTQVVLLERTRNGSIRLFAPPFDLGDPVVSDEGVAESDALVVLTTPSGQTLVAREDISTRSDAKGAGIYRFSLDGAALERGGAYRLSVRTTKGESLVAETTVPTGIPASLAVSRVFDRARDTVTVQWPSTAGARSYLVRIETPFGPRSFFTESTHVRLTGELRNVDQRQLVRVFIPGFPQAVTVSAVDSNFYDWYRTQNDALTGTGLVNRVQGGMGVFGSLVRLRFESYRVVAPQDEPEAGNFVAVGDPAELAANLYPTLELYVESRSARSDQPDALSGRAQRRRSLGETGCQTCGLLGAVRDGRSIQLYFLSAWSATDTVEVLTGEIRGDTIVGSYRGLGGIVHFVKQR